mgnify:CR=1 FL=1
MVEPEIGGIYDSFGRERIREQENWYGKYADLDEEELAELEERRKKRIVIMIRFLSRIVEGLSNSTKTRVYDKMRVFIFHYLSNI